MSEEKEQIGEIGQDKKFELQLSKTSLVDLDLNPAVQIATAQEINSAVYGGFEIQRFLETLNERLFKNKGTIEPFKQHADLIVDVPNKKDEEESSSSRFTRLFVARYESEKVQAKTRLMVDDWEILKMFKGEKKPKSFDICIYHDVDINNKSLSLNIASFLYFKYEDAKVYLNRMSNGRIINFSLNSIPSNEDIGKQLMKNTLEVLQELGAQGIDLEKEKEDEAS